MKNLKLRKSWSTRGASRHPRSTRAEHVQDMCTVSISQLESIHQICIFLFNLDATRTNRPAVEAWRQQKRKSPQNKKPSLHSAQTSRDTTQQQSNNSNSSSQQGTVTFGYNCLDYQGIVQPTYLHGISPQVVPNYINNMNYFGPRPQLSVVREDSREQEAEIGSTESLDNESDRRSCDQIQSTASANVRPAVSDLNLDSNYEVILLSPSTPPPPYSDSRVIAIV